MGEIDRIVGDLQAVGFDFRQVENIVDDSQQCLARGLDRVDLFLLILVERRLGQQFGHANDAGHRRADLMAHVGQEAPFHHVGLLSSTAC